MNINKHFFCMFLVSFTKLSDTKAALDEPQDNYLARVYQGLKVKITDYPYNAYLLHLYKDNRYSECGGAIIGRKWILSAGHCWVDGTDLTVYVGSAEKIKGDAYKVKNHFIHSNYIQTSPKGVSQYDYLLLELTNELRLKDTVKVIKIGLESYINEQDGRGYLTGFGSILGKPPFLGDSGSPLIFEAANGEQTLIGIVSRPTKTKTKPVSYIVVYSSVPYVLEWINKITAQSQRRG